MKAPFVIVAGMGGRRAHNMLMFSHSHQDDLGKIHQNISLDKKIDAPSFYFQNFLQGVEQRRSVFHALATEWDQARSGLREGVRRLKNGDRGNPAAIP
jgi:hypothetical protein